MKKFILITILILITLASSVLVSADEITVFYDNIKINFNRNTIYTDTSPFIYAGRTFTPARTIAEAMGGTVFWNTTTNTVEIYNYATEDLKELAYGIYSLHNYLDIHDKISECYSNILTICDNKINGTLSEKSIEIYKKTLETLKDDYNLLEKEYMNNFEYHSQKGWCDIEKIRSAVFGYKIAIDNIEKAFALCLENPYSDIKNIMHNINYYDFAATKIFSDYLDNFMELTFGY